MMRASELRVLVIRHAVAKDPAQFATTGAADAERPLTKEGEKKMRRAYHTVATLAREEQLDQRTAAFVLAIKRVTHAAAARKAVGHLLPASLRG